MIDEKCVLTLSNNKSLTGLTPRDERIIGEAYEYDIRKKDKIEEHKSYHIKRGLSIIENILRVIDLFGETIEVESIQMDAGVVCFKCLNANKVPVLVRFEPGFIRRGNGLVYLINALEAKIVEYSVVGIRKNKIQISSVIEEFDTTKNPLRVMFDEAYLSTISRENNTNEEELIFNKIKMLKAIKNSLLKDKVKRNIENGEEKSNIM